MIGPVDSMDNSIDITTMYYFQRVIKLPIVKYHLAQLVTKTESLTDYVLYENFLVVASFC